MRRLVLIEFTVDTEKRSAGSRLWVDKMSVVGFCDKQKVATRVVSTPPPVIPAPVVVVDAEPVDTTPAGVDADE